MKYISTRGQNSQKLSFNQILLAGLAPDGGLYLPETYPQISADELQVLREASQKSYAELAFLLLQKFIDSDDISAQDLRKIVEKTYTSQIYKYSRLPENAVQITPLTKINENLYLQELSNGPTLAFKDMAMQLLGNLFEFVLQKYNRQLNILGATSGDTGSAAEYAMKGKKNIRVFMLSPHGKMSDFQRAQMYSLNDENIFNLAVKGMFDDAQDIVKAVSGDAEFKAKYAIGAVNSINWARVLAQIVYYFQGYFLATTNNNQKISFAVPTGNFGNICAGHIAKQMGLPIERLILATNENDVLDEFFKSGIYRPRKSAETFVTSSPSMDISKASNFERFIYDVLDKNSAEVKKYFENLVENQQFSLQDKLKDVAKFGFISGKSSHQDRLQTIKKIYQQTQGKILIDTHTADAVKVATDLQNADEKIVVLETAQAVKFEKTIIEAIGEKPKRHNDFANIENLPQRFEVVENSVADVKKIIEKNC